MANTSDSPRTFLANEAVSAFRAVVISSNGGVGYADDDPCGDGITQQDAASGDYVAVRLWEDGGTQKCILTASPVTAADTLYAAVTGYVSSTGTVAVGRCLTTTGGAANAHNGAIVEFTPYRLA